MRSSKVDPPRVALIVPPSGIGLVSEPETVSPGETKTNIWLDFLSSGRFTWPNMAGWTAGLLIDMGKSLSWARLRGHFSDIAPTPACHTRVSTDGVLGLMVTLS